MLNIKLPKGYISSQSFLKYCESLECLYYSKLSQYINLERFIKSNDVGFMASGIFMGWLNDEKPYPMYCLKQSLLDNLNNTDVGENIKLFTSIQINIPRYILFFPKDSVPFINGSFIHYVVVYLQKLPDTHINAFTFHWAGHDSYGNICFASKNIPRDGIPNKSSVYIDTEDNEDNIKNISMLRNYVMQSILLTQYYPNFSSDIDEVEYQYQFETKGFSKPHKKSNNKDVYIYPRWFGDSDSNVINDKTNGYNKGTHNSPRTHFRRGHYRLQPCGIGNKDNKLIWVRPCWVNPE